MLVTEKVAWSDSESANSKLRLSSIKLMTGSGKSIASIPLINSIPVLLGSKYVLSPKPHETDVFPYVS